MTTDDQVPPTGRSEWRPSVTGATSAGSTAAGEPAAGESATAGPAEGTPYEPRTELTPEPAAGATASRNPRRRRASKGIVIGGTLALAAAMTGIAVTSQSPSEPDSVSQEGWTNESGDVVAAPAELEQDYAQVCQDTQTGERIDDQWCEDVTPAEVGADSGVTQDESGEAAPGEEQEQETSSGGHVSHGWFFIPLYGGRTVPAVGAPLRDGSTQAPAGRSVTKVPASGGAFAKSGTVSKGGFGTKGGGAGS